MFKLLYIRQIQEFIYTAKFYIAFVLTVLTFVITTIAFLNSYSEMQDNYTKYVRYQQSQLDGRLQNISKVVTKNINYLFPPRENSLIVDCKETVMPNRIRYSAYNVFDFSEQYEIGNQFIKRSDSLSWSFIVSMLLSFVALMFSYDLISGEKESRTLSLVFSNRVSRGALLSAKLLSVITVTGIMMITSILLCLVIIALSGKISLNAQFMVDVAGFVVISLLLITVFATFGLLASTISKQSNISLLVSLCFWLVMVVVVPNTSVFWSNKLFQIPSFEEINRIIEAEQEDIENNAPEGSWSSRDGNPFYENHQLRAAAQTSLMMCEKKHKDDYYTKMFRQFEQTRMLTIVSPIAQFGYMNEAFQGGGYLRFRKNWDDLHLFCTGFLQWFKDIDAKDENSPHWYNPYEDLSTSRQAVAIDQIPQYREQIASVGQRIEFIATYLIAMISSIALLFVISFAAFLRYDVR